MNTSPDLVDDEQAAAMKTPRPKKLRRVLAPYFLPLGLIAIWEIALKAGWWPQTLIAPPEAVLSDFVRLIAHGDLYEHFKASMGRLLQGFAFGGAAGLVVGSWIGLSQSAQRYVEPTLAALAPIPPPAWIPLLVILLGIEEASKIALIALGVFFVMAANTISGIRNVDARLVEVGRIFEKNDYEILTEILLPGAMPAILTGARIALGLSWVLLIAAELVAAKKGLGWFIWDSRNFSRPDDMIVGMLCIGLLGMLSDRIVLFFQRRLLSWQTVLRGQ